MYFVFGTRLFGKVDHVPGYLHVATQFAHVNYVPLFPTKSWVVTKQDGNSWRGFPIGLSAKSIFVAWMRCALIVGAAGGVVMAIIGASDRRQDMSLVAGGIVLSVLCIGGMIGSYYLPGVGRATRGRVLSLGQKLGLSQEVIDQLCTTGLKLSPAAGFPVQLNKPQAAMPLQGQVMQNG